MKICLLEPFYTGSHKAWAMGYQQASRHEVKILSLPGFHWKWRMHGGAVSLANQFLQEQEQPDLILATDMLDLSVFLSLTRKKTQDIPVAIYFHENQLTYPWSPSDPDPKLKRDNHYAFINYASALSANHVFFNSSYHLNSFVDSLPDFLNQFPDFQEYSSIEEIKEKSSVLPLGMDLKQFDPHLLTNSSKPLNILWNHRWEYDKNPEAFFAVLSQLAGEGLSFSLSVIGQSFKESPAIFREVEKVFRNQLIHFGYQHSFADYAKVLAQADILPVTSKQDFFGGAVVEAIYCGLYPLLPNRLAYPEHLPEEDKAMHLYNDESLLLDKMRLLLSNEAGNIKKERLRHFVATYDWTTLGPVYDQTFENLVV